MNRGPGANSSKKPEQWLRLFVFLRPIRLALLPIS